MGRHKSFNQDKILDKAMHLFWQNGYAATSIQDLEDHLGIGRRSLYNTFNSKWDLYLAALDRYQSSGNIFPTEPPESALETLRAIFTDLVTAAVANPTSCGCFFVNTTVELAPHDEEIANRSAEALQNTVQAFHQLIEQAQREGTIAAEKDAHALAQFLANSLYGLRVMEKMSPDHQLLTNIVNTTFTVLT